MDGNHTGVERGAEKKIRILGKAKFRKESKGEGGNSTF